ncbi:MAG: urate hydroxylase PuuD, partial [Armatimonadetes bacterium]|nr:urate hydroxylase PuuD [Armatimonadota bacterium]
MTPAVEWLQFLFRWLHIVAAIMWIGDSLLFMWIDSHLDPDPQGRRDVAGVTWLIHGGGYYHLEKRLLVPGRLPPRLRWFWLEATTTWLSGFLLLVLIYYMSADAFMVDRSVSSLTSGQ